MEEHMCCMNVACRARIVKGEVKKGWGLRSGGFVILCHACGTAYEQLDFCNMFHIKETGWRECNSCGKQLHCGCIASRSFVELLDGGGVQCIGCMKNSELSTIPTGILRESSNKCPENEKENGFDEATVGYVYQSHLLAADPNMDASAINKDIMDMRKPIECSGRSSSNGLFGNIKHEAVMLSIGDAGNKIFLNMNQVHQGPSGISKYDDSKTYIIDKGMHQSLTQTCLDISLGTCNPNNVVEACYNTVIPKFSIPVSKGLAEERETNKAKSSFLQMQKSCNLLPKLPRITNGNGSETSRDMLPNLRVARPPCEGKGRNQLLPRYWPRITDQELRQISGDPNSTIVPLFEKVLSASDAGRIGRLVLPKACAEAYFPPISQPEGLPLKIQDAKGKDWIFQFRFWPNNNSRMYVLEGVTPCIHSMQLQAGDTVTFSRIDPEGKLVMGFRKATNSVPLQDSQITTIANVTLCSESYLSGVADKLPIVSSHPGLLQSPKGSADLPCNDFSRFNSWNKINIQGDRSIEEFQMQSPQVPEKRRGCNISSKSKRLHIGNEDALELKMTWEEVQDLLCPPPTAKPSIVVIDDHEFEEYEEPPVLGKRTIFTPGTSGSHDQWVQCDNCSKWRRLPMDVVLSSKWSCADNTWDPKRSLKLSSCSVPDEMNPEVLQSFLQQSAGFRKRKIAAIYKPPISQRESSALDTLANSTLLGEDGPSTSSIVATTKHPRHRPACTCIVCIQPPSGKGSKHKRTCTCNVCITVKRRFKTLMLRKKKRQSECEEAEISKKREWLKKNEIDADTSFKTMIPLDTNDELESESGTPWAEMGKGQIDLNCHPVREENQQVESSRVSMMSLLQVASLPLETYLKQNGLASLVCEQQVSSSTHAASQVPPGLSKAGMHDESCHVSMSRVQDSGADEGHGGSHQSLK